MEEGAFGIECDESELDLALEETNDKEKLLKLLGKKTVELNTHTKS